MVVDGCGGAEVVVLVRGREELLVLPDDGRAVADEWTAVVPQAVHQHNAKAKHQGGRRALSGGGSHGGILFPFMPAH